MTGGKQTISHYRILEKLGGGGMGVVYKAEDLRLKRTVALKFLPPDLTRDETARARFVQEAQAASTLDHPHICTVHEIDQTPDGQMFIAMTYYKGETLKKLVQRGPLPVERAIDITCQITEGLAEAHQHGIVHRDIKPANVMMTQDGLAKIVDFGLAKLPDITGLTQTGMTWGTAAYMSPEQARGDPVDQRTDLWALGVLLYEMLAGRPPFRGDSPHAAIYAILNTLPEPLHGLRPSLPADLECIAARALSKDPAKRYQQANELLADLRAFKRKLESTAQAAGVAAVKRLPSVAVLPFSDMSQQRDQDYFCEGMAEELINAFTNLDGVRVASRTSAFQFKGQALDIRRIGEQLDVQSVLEGSIRKAGNRLRITAQLINVADGYHLWSDRYDRDMDDVFAIQDEIARAIVDKLKVKLVGDANAPLVRRSTGNLEAYNLCLKGRYYWNKRAEDELKKGIQHFRDAVEQDPSYALAYVGLADSYNMLAIYTALSPHEAFPRGKAAALRALSLDDTLAEAHTSLAFAALWFDWDWATAGREFERAIELNAGYATAHNWYAEYLAIMGRRDEALAEARRAHGLDPLSLMLHTDVGWHHYFKRQYDDAIEHLEKALEMDPGFWPARIFLGQAYEQKSMFGEAIREFEKAVSLSRRSARSLAALGHAYAVSGDTAQAHKVLDELKASRSQTYVPPQEIAIIYAGLDKKDQAFEWLEKAFEERASWLLLLNLDPRYEPLHSDSRFQDLVRRIGLSV